MLMSILSSPVELLMIVTLVVFLVSAVAGLVIFGVEGLPYSTGASAIITVLFFLVVLFSMR